MVEFRSLRPSDIDDDFDGTSTEGRPIVTVHERDDGIRLEYTFPGFMLSGVEPDLDDGDLPFQEIGMSGVGFLSESGRPLVPSFGRFVQVPMGCEYSVDIKKGHVVEYEDILVKPAQELVHDMDDEADFEFDKLTYGEDAWYPRELVEVTGPQEMDDYQVLLVHVRPLQVNPVKKLVRGHSNITVDITLDRASDAHGSAEQLLADPETNREGFGNLIANPRRGIGERIPGVAPRISVSRPIHLTGPEFLIIHDKALAEPAKRLARWKERRGIRTEVVSIKSIGADSAKIKKYIRKRRGERLSRLRYVLLMGDVMAIPTEEVAGATTDHYYYTSADSASMPLMPWVSGGRIPVHTAEEATEIVDQIIRYEKRPPCDPEYYRRMTFAAYFQDDAPKDSVANRAYMKTMEGIREHMVGLGFEVERVYVSNTKTPAKYIDMTPVPAEVKAAIVDSGTATDALISTTSEGQLVIAHRDHGGPTGWVHPEFHDTHLKGLRSQYQSMFYSVNCVTGQFDANPLDCFAETILKLDGGAPSLIAATENSGTWRNDSLMKAMFDGMWPGVLPTFPGTTMSYPIRFNRLGDLLNYAKSYLLVKHGTGSGVKHHFEIYHVIGDPTLQLWSAPPIPLQLRATIRRDMLQIRMDHCPDGAVMTLWADKTMVRRIEPRYTWLRIQLPELLEQAREMGVEQPRTVSVCLAAPDHRFCEVRSRVIR